MQKEDTRASSVSSASLIDLKAELFRKQEEFNVIKQQNPDSGFIKGKSAAAASKKLNIWKKSNAGVTKRAEKDYEEKIEEEDAFEKSKRKLESKAKLYEQITQGTEFPDEDGSGQFLVDFQQKVINEESNKSKKPGLEERTALTEEEEFRRHVYEAVPAASAAKPEGDMDTSPTLMSGDMRREQQRLKWEQEKEATLGEKPIHYSDVLHDEIRTHGVGYYKFDTDELVRQEQLAELGKLREKTKDERSKSDRIKDKRKAALAARLAKVKQRKRERAGLPGTASDDEKSSGDEIGPQPVKQPEVVEPLTRDDSWRQTVKSTREWDKDKDYVLQRTEQSWLEKQRAEREEEFAPPSFYYQDNRKKGGTKIKSQSDSVLKKATDGSSYISNQEKSDATNLSIYGQSLNEAPGHGMDPETTVEGGNSISPSVVDQTTLDKNEMRLVDTDISISSKCRGSGSVDGGTVRSNESGSSSAYVCSVPSVPLYTPSDGHELPPTNTDLPNVVTSHPPPNINAPPSAMVYQFPDGKAQLSVMNILPPNANIPPPCLNVPPPNTTVPPSVDRNFPSNVSNVPQAIVTTSHPSIMSHASPPNLNVPVPNMNVPPTPNTNVPPPNMNVPLPNMSIPPPNLYALPINMSVLPPNTTGHLTAVPVSTARTGGTTNINSPSGVCAVVAERKVIPKLSIVDTRLMASEDD